MNILSDIMVIAGLLWFAVTCVVCLGGPVMYVVSKLLP